MKSQEGSKCCSTHCPYKLKIRCARFQESANGATKYTPMGNPNGTYWCVAFDLKQD